MSELEHALRVQIAQEHRRKVRDPERIAELQRRRAAERIRESITKITETAPPLTLDERRELAALLLTFDEQRELAALFLTCDERHEVAALLGQGGASVAA